MRYCPRYIPALLSLLIYAEVVHYISHEPPEYAIIKQRVCITNIHGLSQCMVYVVNRVNMVLYIW